MTNYMICTLVIFKNRYKVVFGQFTECFITMFHMYINSDGDDVRGSCCPGCATLSTSNQGQGKSETATTRF